MDIVRHILRHTLLLPAAILLLMSCHQHRYHAAPTAADSIYSKAHILQIHITDPDRALSIIDTMEMRQLVPAYAINYLRCIVYQNALQQPRLAIYYAGKAVGDPLFELQEPENCCSAINLLAERDYRRNNFSQSLSYAKRGLEIARRHQLKVQELNFAFAIGRNMLFSGDEEEGMRILQNVLRQDQEELAHPTSILEINHLIYTCGEMMELYLRRGKLAEAEALIPHAENMLALMEETSGLPAGYKEFRSMEIYSNIMKLYDEMHDFKKSEIYLKKMLASEDTKASSLMRAAGHYLATQQYGELLATLKQANKFFLHNFDSISTDYVDKILGRQLKAYTALGEEQKARITAQRIIAIKDSLNRRAQEGDAAQLSKIYETQEKERRLQEQEQALSTQRSYLNLSISGLAVAFVLIGLMVYYNRRINRQSKATVSAIRQLIDPTEKDAHSDSASQMMEDMRLRQAANLFRTNPELEVSEVAARCGMGDDLPSFNRLFIRHFGLPPAEYRKWSLRIKHEESRYKEEKRSQEKATDQMKENFIQNMSHEIRTPLNQISGFVQLLTDPNLTMEESEKRKVNDIIAEQTQYMTQVLNTFLEMSEYDSSDTPLPVEEVSIDAILAQVSDATRQPQPGVTLRFENRSGLSTLQTQSKALCRLLLCLTDNAVKYTSEGGIEVAYYLDDTDGTPCFSVTDTGIGIPEGEEEKIFDRFYKVDPYVPGVGIGLSLARQIALRLGISLFLDRHYTGQGSRFVVRMA